MGYEKVGCVDASPPAHCPPPSLGCPLSFPGARRQKKKHLLPWKPARREQAALPTPTLAALTGADVDSAARPHWAHGQSPYFLGKKTGGTHLT